MKTLAIRNLSYQYPSSETPIFNGIDLVVYCAQSTEFAPEALETFMSTYTKEAFKLRNLLGVDDAWLGAWDVLSHGERKRLQLAVALSAESDVLVVDEPTNHMDLDSIVSLEASLQDYKGALVFITHDKSFLENISTKQWVFEKSEKERYSVQEIL